MRIRTTETFEQKYKSLSSQSHPYAGQIDYLKFNKNEIYHFFVVPKVVSIDLEKDEAEIDYPFEEVTTHFNAYDFMKNYANMKPERLDCRGNCVIENWMSENRLPKSIFKIAVGTKFFLSYVIHEKRIKIAWLQDYLYRVYLEQIAKLMNDKEIGLVDAFRHRIKLYTDSSGKFNIEIDQSVSIPPESPGFKNILQNVHDKPLNTYIDQQITTDNETMEVVLRALKSYAETVVKNEQDRAKREMMDEKTKKLASAFDVDFREPKKETNGIITDESESESISVGPNSLPEDHKSVEDEDPF